MFLNIAAYIIDKLNVPNVSKEMCRIIYKEIYQKEELSIERTNTDLMISSFSDLDNLLYDKLYDVVNFANLSSNKQNSQAYNIVLLQGNRIEYVNLLGTRLTDF